MQQIIRIKEFIINELLTDSEYSDLKKTDLLIESGIIDSLSIQKLIVFLEEQFDVAVESKDILPGNFETVEAIGSLINRKKSSFLNS